MQGVATSIDALSVGFTIAEYGWLMALAASGIIAVVTFFLCMAGLRIGKKFGTKLSGKASVLGGIIPHRHWAGNFHLRRVLLKRAKNRHSVRQALCRFCSPWNILGVHYFSGSK